ncbi:hypothetical protein [Natrinema saccharevitans]|uniref:hypothetical protein n=1 Tax=Natrinema saccharevitans TaxID=301967 RepID=UPI00111597F2|nr:hypothetical protein [Natrinema saccharevitans]
MTPSGNAKVVSYILGRSDVDSFDDPLKPSVSWANGSNRWALMWHYEDPPELSDEYAPGDMPQMPYYDIKTHRAEFQLDFGDNTFDDDLNTDNHFPTKDTSDPGISVSIGAGFGPVSVGVGKAITGTTNIGFDHKDNSYTEWDYAVNNMPDGKDNAAGVVFDVVGGNNDVTAEMTAEWNRGYYVTKTTRSGQETLFTRGEGRTFDLDVDVTPLNDG